MTLRISHTDDQAWPTPDAWFDFFEPVVAKTLECASDIPDAWVSVLLSDAAFIHTLNRVYRGYDKPTNVLSFPMHDDSTKEPCLGDVVLSFETIKHEADDAGILFEAHAAHMMVHGVLHLLGFQHETDDDAEEMETLECHIMKQLGYDSPYPDRVVG